MFKGNFIIAAILAALLGPFAGAAEDTFLIPVHIYVQGNYGSAFMSDLRIFNPGDHTVVVRGLEYPCVTLCPSPLFEISVNPGETRSTYSLLGAPGVLIHVPAGAPLKYNLRARDTSRDSKSAGTEIPVVPLGRFAPKVTLLGVPNGELFRSMVRIYASQSTNVTIAVLRESDNTPLQQRSVSLSVPRDEYDPAYAEITGLPASAAPVRIEISSSSSELIWAFASTTNNVTQEITITSPQ